MDGNTYRGMLGGKGMLDGIRSWLIVLPIVAVFGVWKLVEVAIWLFTHIHIAIR